MSGDFQNGIEVWLARGVPSARRAPVRDDRRCWTLWRTFEIDIQFLFCHEATERPRVDEPVAVAVAEVVEYDAASLTHAGRHLEEVHQLLRCQPAGQWFRPYTGSRW